MVIFDEVHAYDVYMSTLFRRLLDWLKAIGASVVILSATLPEKTRQELASAYAGKRSIEVPNAPYPRMTTVSAAGIQAIPLPMPAERRIGLEWIDQTPEALVDFLRHELDQGGCAAVICNRVARAQNVYQVIQKARIVEEENLLLFHARFPFAWRAEIEEQTLNWFSKTGQRPTRAILVATQVVEQSLDLDFDLLVSDLAPIDLLVQRAGRLHRHAQNTASRPENLRQPRLVLARPKVENGLPDFGADTWVYERCILLQTWNLLQTRAALRLPGETSELIESVYSDTISDANIPPNLVAAIQESRQAMRMQQDKDEFNARGRLTPRSSDEELLHMTDAILMEEEDPNLHQALRGLTRLAEPSISLICLHSTPAGLALEPDGRGAPLNLETRPDHALVEQFALRAVNISRREVIQHFQNLPAPAGWNQIAALRFHQPVIFKDGVCVLGEAGIVLYLDRHIGLSIEKITPKEMP